MTHPGRRSPSMLAAAAVLCLAAPGCQGSEPAGSASSAKSSQPEAATMDATKDAATVALLAELDRAPARVLRAIAVLRPGQQAKAQASAALKAAGAAAAQDLAPQPMLVVEVNAAQLRALLRTGQVTTVQRDAAAPTN